MPTFKEQRDKIIEAYFRDEIEPFDGKFCFCGTLNNNCSDWTAYYPHSDYSPDEYNKMERALFSGLEKVGLVILEQRYMCFCNNKIDHWEQCNKHPNYENALFDGMSAALDVLKQIHIERGENIDEGDVPAFAKRDLTLSKS